MNTGDKQGEFKMVEETAEGNLSQDQKSNDETTIELEALRGELIDCQEMLLRTRAENENQRKRLEREIKTSREFAVQDFTLNLLPMKDSLETGIELAMEEGPDTENMFEGMMSSLKICEGTFKVAGVIEINPSQGDSFNPELHEAMSIKPSESADPNTILAVFQKGYLLNGRLIRPAKVAVSTT
jgi:molecular chaperone GrpE